MIDTELKDLIRKAYKAGRRNALKQDETNLNDFINKNESKLKLFAIPVFMPMFADDSNLGNEKRVELIKDYKNKIPGWTGTYEQGFADCFNWLLREYEKAN